MNIQIQNLCKSYDGLSVLKNLNMELHGGQTYCLMGASGAGKTTLLRILLGLEAADSGSVLSLTDAGPSPHLVAVFQEDRLCEHYSPLENVMMVTDPTMTADMVKAELIHLLPEESVNRPVSTLSGGMKRRTAVCRALLAPSDAILMDEPFTGLDEQTKLLVIDYIKEKAAGKLLVVTTHQEEDVQLLDAALLHLSQ